MEGKKPCIMEEELNREGESGESLNRTEEKPVEYKEARSPKQVQAKTPKHTLAKSPKQAQAKSPKLSQTNTPKQAEAKKHLSEQKKESKRKEQAAPGQQNEKRSERILEINQAAQEVENPDHMTGKSQSGHSVRSRDENMNIGFIGAGNMAKAIVKGLLDSYSSDKLFVAAPTDRNLAFFEKLKCRTTHNNNDIVSQCQVVFLCVKPAQFELAIREITDWQGHLIISVLAGVPLERLYKLIYKDNKPLPKIIRCAPNTPMMVSKGVCCISPGAGVPVQDTQLALELLKPCCLIVKTVPEAQLDAICALSGSGPAFLYMVIEALSDGAVKMGLPRDLAMELAAAMVEGSARMVSHTGYHPGQLKDAVASPGGTTICGIHVLEKGSLRSLFMDAIEATTLKSAQLRGNQ